MNLSLLVYPPSLPVHKGNNTQQAPNLIKGIWLLEKVLPGVLFLSSFGPEARVIVWTGVTNRPYYLCIIIRGKNRQANPAPPPKRVCRNTHLPGANFSPPPPTSWPPRQWCQPWGCQEACCHANNPGWEGAMEMGDWSSSWGSGLWRAGDVRQKSQQSV